MDFDDSAPRYLLLDDQGEAIGCASSLRDAVCPEGGAIYDTFTGEYYADGEGLLETGAALEMAVA